MSQSSVFFGDIAEGLDEPVLAVRRDGEILSVNKAAARSFGIPEESFAGRNVKEVFQGEWAEKFFAIDEKSISSPGRAGFQAAVTIDGKIYFTDNLIFLSSTSGNRSGSVLVVSSVLPSGSYPGGVFTAPGKILPHGGDLLLKQIEFIMAATKTNLDIIDPEFNIRYVDKGWQELYGDPSGKKCYDYFMDRSEPCEGCGLLKALESRKPVVTEEVLKKEGNRAIQVTTIPFQDPDGNWLLAEVNVDITGRKKMENEMREMNAFLDLIIENIPNMIFLKDSKELRFVKFNKAGEELLGYKKEELLGKNDYDFFPKEQADFFIEKDRQALLGKEPLDIAEEVIDTREKGKRILHTKKVPIHNDKGEAVFLLGISEDVTERKRIEDSLREHQREIYRQWGILNNLVDNIPFFVFWKNRNSEYMGCNRAFTRVAGIERPEDIIGKTDYDLAWERSEADFYRKIDKEVMDKGEPMLNIEETQLQADGKRASILTSKVPLKDAEGNVTGILGIYADITERREMEAKLKLFKDLMDQSGDSLFLTDNKGRFLDVDDQACFSLGYSREELLGMGVLDIERLLFTQEELDRQFEDLKRTEGLVFRGEHQRKNGEVFPVEINMKFVELESKGYVVAVARDITERMRLESELKDSERKYRTIFENTGTITAIVEDDMYFSMVNSEFERFFGFNPQASDIRKRLDELVCEEDRERVINYHRLRRIDPESIPAKYEVRMKDRDSKQRDTYVTVAMIPGTGSSVVSFLDLTDLKEKELELKKQRDLLDSTNKALEHKITELNTALGHIKRLEGLVPICSSCKKIMKSGGDPKKMDSWVNIEKYISDRTEASFTHGLCPDCMEKFYGDYVGKKKKKA